MTSHLLRSLLTSFEGRIPLANGELPLRWDLDAETLRYWLCFPDGYRVKFENQSGRELMRAK